MQQCVIYTFNLRILTLILLLSLPFIAKANTSYAKDNTFQAKEYITGLIEAVEQINLKNDIAEQRLRLAELIGQNIDIEEAATFVLGRFRTQLSSEQFNSFKQEYKTCLKEKYALLLSGNDGKAKVLNSNYSGNNTYLVKTRVKFEDRSSEIDYTLKLKGDKFYISDITVGPNVRLSVLDRSQFMDIIQKNGVEYFLNTFKTNR